MGHTNSKRKREKQLKRELSDYILNNLSPGDDEVLHRVTQLKINQLSSDLEKLSIASSYLSKDSVIFPESTNSTMSLNRNLHSHLSARQDCDIKDSFSYEKLNVDDDPVLSKLQNEQNRRLEKMEERMNQIRLHAMQEVERRKFAHLFRAKTEPTKQLLAKTKDSYMKDVQLEPLLDANNDMANVVVKNSQDTMDSKTLLPCTPDRGEIIPVTIVKEDDKEPVKDNDVEKTIKKKSLLQTMPALNNMDFNDPKSYLFLPFLFPIFVILMVLRSLQDSDSGQQRNGHNRHKKRN